MKKVNLANCTTGENLLILQDMYGEIMENGIFLESKGIWNENTQYNKNDLVSFNGGSYLSTIANIGYPPNVNLEKWQIIAIKGENGETGATGATGNTGATGATGESGGRFIEEDSPIASSVDMISKGNVPTAAVGDIIISINEQTKGNMFKIVSESGSFFNIIFLYNNIGKDGKDGTNGTNGTNGKDAKQNVFFTTQSLSQYLAYSLSTMLQTIKFKSVFKGSGSIMFVNTGTMPNMEIYNGNVAIASNIVKVTFDYTVMNNTANITNLFAIKNNGTAFTTTTYFLADGNTINLKSMNSTLQTILITLIGEEIQIP